MNNNWQENKWLYDKTYTKRPKDSMLRMAPVHVYSLKNPQAVKGAVKAQPGRDERGIARAAVVVVVIVTVGVGDAVALKDKGFHADALLFAAAAVILTVS